MSKAVKSDGSIQKQAESFVKNFDELTNVQIAKAVKHFSTPKENGREAIDNVNLPTIMEMIVKMYKKYDKAPSIFKWYAFIKLQQGKATWEKELKPKEKMPWD